MVCEVSEAQTLEAQMKAWGRQAWVGISVSAAKKVCGGVGNLKPLR